MGSLKHVSVFLFVIGMMMISFSGCTGPAGIQGPAGEKGVGVSSASVNTSGHLILKLSNGQTIDAGYVIGPEGPQGVDFTSSFATIVPQIEPSIVRIDVATPSLLSSGSGTIIDSRGFIITNAHIIKDSGTIHVTLIDGSTLIATIVGLNTEQDLAIIKLNSDRSDFPVITLGTMFDVIVGDEVMAAGFPLGTDLPGPATFTKGVVSAMRNYGGIDYIQTDTPINPGNSGGCLFTIDGKMIGIPSEIITPPREDYEDINLVIPIDQVKAFIDLYLE